jgi:hypothetical protein
LRAVSTSAWKWLVEAHHVVEGGRFVHRLIGPESDHRGAQRAVFGDELIDVEATAGAQDGVHLCGGGGGVVDDRGPALRLGMLRPATLCRADVCADRIEDLRCVIAQGEHFHAVGCRQHGRGKGDPFRENCFTLSLEEIRQAHSLPHAVPMSTDTASKICHRSKNGILQ